MTAIERLNESHAEKLAYYMSKADQVEKEHDRQRVLIQITQNLSSRIKNSHAFKLPTIYLPRDDLAVPIPNALEEVCEDIDKAIRLTVQKNLTTMKDDCARIVARIGEAHGEQGASPKRARAAGATACSSRKWSSPRCWRPPSRRRCVRSVPSPPRFEPTSCRRSETVTPCSERWSRLYPRVTRPRDGSNPRARRGCRGVLLIVLRFSGGSKGWCGGSRR